MCVLRKEGVGSKMAKQDSPMRKLKYVTAGFSPPASHSLNPALLVTNHGLSKVRHAARLATSHLTENKRNRITYPETHFGLLKLAKSEPPAKEVFRRSERFKSGSAPKFPPCNAMGVSPRGNDCRSFSVPLNPATHACVAATRPGRTCQSPKLASSSKQTSTRHATRQKK
jgi:hypothetical protein